MWNTSVQVQRTYAVTQEPLFDGGLTLMQAFKSYKKSKKGMARYPLTLHHLTDVTNHFLLFNQSNATYGQDFGQWEGKGNYSPRVGKSIYTNKNATYNSLQQVYPSGLFYIWKIVLPTHSPRETPFSQHTRLIISEFMIASATSPYVL